MSDAIKAKTVFTSVDSDELMFVYKVCQRGATTLYDIIFENGHIDWFTIEELNIDMNTIRQYNADTDPDFYGMLM